MNSYRLLKIIFVILLLVTFGELGYYVYYQFNRDKYINGQKDLQLCMPAVSQNSVLNTTLIERLKFMPPIAFVSSVVKNQYQGKIVELDLKGGQQPIDKSKYKNVQRDFFEYQIGLKIKQEKEKETLDFFWDKDILTRIKVYTREGKEVRTINFSDLQVGDGIEVYQTIDLMNKNCVSDQCIVGYDIYKI